MELRLSQPGWVGAAVELACDPRTRLHGLRPAPGGRGLMLWGRSIHTVGMATALRIVEADRAGIVVTTSLLYPRRMLWRSRPRWFIELAATTPPPRPGIGLAAAPMLGRWPVA